MDFLLLNDKLTLSVPVINNWFMNSIAFWTFILLGSMVIGGFFMFRKFLKVLPKADGKSKLDWQNHWVESSRHLWTEDAKSFLDELVQPVPGPSGISRSTLLPPRLERSLWSAVLPKLPEITASRDISWRHPPEIINF